MPSTRKKPVLLVVRDGWGFNPHPEQDKYNAVKLARKPCDDWLHANFPCTLVAASGLDVGVPAGVMGNSEVGHQNIGAGRIVDQEIVRISKAIDNGEIERNEVWLAALKRVKERGSKLHFMGLCSDAGVHSMLDISTASSRWPRKPASRRTSSSTRSWTTRHPASERPRFIHQIEAEMAKIGVVRSPAFADASGRWIATTAGTRLEGLRDARGKGRGHRAQCEQAVQNYYDKPASDARRATSSSRRPGSWAPMQAAGHVRRRDAVIFFNFRGDRPREISRAFAKTTSRNSSAARRSISSSPASRVPEGAADRDHPQEAAKMENILGDWLAKHGKTQFRTAETEKYAHVTFFFNDYREEPFPGEDRVLVASPKVSTYDLAPDMSSASVTVNCRDAILSGKYDLIVVNYANPDMVGHTGSIPAATRACEATDLGVGVLVEAVLKMGGSAVICADHGNSEQLWDTELNSPFTSHTTNLVEVFVVGEGLNAKTKLREGGRLADIAPTLLKLMKMPQPAEMTGKSLL
jgi:2,3-bisphosphoglycerate-independent phosphoglycerate mutase